MILHENRIIIVPFHNLQVNDETGTERNYDYAWCQDVVLFVSGIAQLQLSESSDHHGNRLDEMMVNMPNRILKSHDSSGLKSEVTRK